jgi:uncharacterized protein YqeY
MFVERLKAEIAQATKGRDVIARDVLRLAFGEIQTAEARGGGPLSDDAAAAIVRKLVKSNEETLASADGERAAALRREIEVLSALLPKGLSVEEIVAALAGQADAIKAAKNDGQATGIAMKHLKATGATFDGADAATAVKTIRG